MMNRTDRLLVATPALLAALALTGPALGQAAPPPDAARDPAADAAPSERSPLTAKLEAEMGRSNGLTSRQVGERAATTSLDARAKDADVRAAETELDKAMVAYFPRLSLLARYTRLSNITPVAFGGGGALVGTNRPVGSGPIDVTDPATVLVPIQFAFPIILDQYTLQASLTVPISDYVLRLSQAYTAASRSRDAARLQATASRAVAAADAKLAYYSWARAKLQTVVAEQSLVQAEAQLKDAKALFSVDRVSKADVMRAESRVAAAELLIERARNAASVTEDQIRVRTHDESSAPYELGENLLDPIAPVPKVPPATLYAEAVRQRPEIRALEQSAYALREQSRSVSAGNWPRIDAGGNYTYANPNQRFIGAGPQWRGTWDVSIQLTWSPNDIGTSSATAAGLDAKAAALEAQRAALADGLRFEVLAAYQAAREADVAITTTKRALDSAEEAYRVRRELFKADKATATEVTDAETALLQARLEHVNAHVDARVARVKLERALGRDTPGRTARRAPLTRVARR